jgi:hypothetical protein
LSQGARWRRDLLGKSLAERYERFEAAIDASRELAGDFLLKNQPASRRMALARLKKRFADAHFEVAQIDEKPPLASWSILHPRRRLVVDPNHPRDDQKCLGVDYVLVCKLPGSFRMIGARSA